MINYNQIHHIIIGYQKSIPQLYINLEILRENFSFGKQLWITVLYEGEQKNLLTARGENSYIHTEVSGYAYGALEQINKGLEFAQCFDRDVIVLHNFDVLWFSEAGYNKTIQDFIDSGKQISAAVDANGLVSTDCMIFRKEFLKEILPIKMAHCQYREKLEIAERYKNTELKWANVEECLWSRLIDYANKCQPSLEIVPVAPGVENNPINQQWNTYDNDYRNWLLNKVWHKMDRTDLPRLRFSENINLGHLHEIKEIKELLIKNNIKNGNVINQVLKANL